MKIGSFALPIRLECVCAEEVTFETVTRSREQALEKARLLCGFYQRDRLSEVEILDYAEEVVCKEHLLLKATFTCRENIGIEKEIEE